jgi:hypothetical protein
MPADCDVIHFSPFVDAMVFDLNVFEQGDKYQPGLLRVSSMFFASLGLSTPTESIVNHSDNSIFCNYFIAKPAFWEEWLRINEAMFELTENQPGEIADSLRAMTIYENQGLSMKVFVMERIASYMLASQQKWKSRNASPFSLPSSNSSIDLPSVYITALDALKRAYVSTNTIAYLNSYFQLRAWLLANCKPEAKPQLPS